ncbi:MAG: hypothetical protein WCQ69_05305 [Bacteroidales bacterium]|jgi:flagellar basal body-associated protein FliL|nr:hypothetical protein [Bacteroidales bacterium]MDD2264207.1 hypothetical protein [Bacteroidales bacterium]MDD2831321.1 hypothetical protein [Bacteroidales bacterium]MDD3208316.1 hypothetical protein [Bacteroidales bacterium]MDD3697001.1 hypothetical protein [Bacteroidales bacterium]
MKTICKPSYPALIRASAGDDALPGRRNKRFVNRGFVILFIMIVLATLGGMVVFLLFISAELSGEKDLHTVSTGDVRALFSENRKEEKRKTAPFFYGYYNEKNTHQTTPR